jgi:hypothetical protein
MREGEYPFEYCAANEKTSLGIVLFSVITKIGPREEIVENPKPGQQKHSGKMPKQSQELRDKSD